MTLLKFNPFVPNAAYNRFNTLDKIINDVFNAPLFKDEVHGTTPSVNVFETEADFKLEIAAPGLTKETFKLHVEDDVLTISAEKKVESTTENEGKTEKVLRREFSYATFKRTFNLPENVSIEGITAAYDNGILTVSIPKVEVKKTTQTIAVA